MSRGPREHVRARGPRLLGHGGSPSPRGGDGRGTAITFRTMSRWLVVGGAAVLALTLASGIAVYAATGGDAPRAAPTPAAAAAAPEARALEPPRSDAPSTSAAAPAAAIPQSTPLRRA